MARLLYDRPIVKNGESENREKGDLTQLTLWQELLDIESWLRRKANEMSQDSRLAARLDRGADHVEQAANRIKERIDQDTDQSEH